MLNMQVERAVLNMLEYVNVAEDQSSETEDFSADRRGPQRTEIANSVPARARRRTEYMALNPSARARRRPLEIHR